MKLPLIYLVALLLGCTSVNYSRGQSVKSPTNYLMCPGDTTAYISVDTLGTFGFSLNPSSFSFIPVAGMDGAVKISVNGAVNDIEKVYLCADTSTKTITLAKFSTKDSSSILWKISPIKILDKQHILFRIESSISTSKRSYYLGSKDGSLLLIESKPSSIPKLNSCWKLWEDVYSGFRKSPLRVVPEITSISNMVLTMNEDSLPCVIPLDTYIQGYTKVEIVDTMVKDNNLFFNVASFRYNSPDTSYLVITSNNQPKFTHLNTTPRPRLWVNMGVAADTTISFVPAASTTINALCIDSDSIVVMCQFGSNSNIISPLGVYIGRPRIPRLRQPLHISADKEISSEVCNLSDMKGQLITVEINNYNFFLFGSDSVLTIARISAENKIEHIRIRPSATTGLFSGWSVANESLYLMDGSTLKQFDLTSKFNQLSRKVKDSVIVNPLLSRGYSSPVIDSLGNVYLVDSLGTVYGFSKNLASTYTKSEEIKANYVEKPELFLQQLAGGVTGLYYFSRTGKQVNYTLTQGAITYSDSALPVLNLAFAKEVGRMLTNQVMLPANNLVSSMNSFTASNGQYVTLQYLPNDSISVLFTSHDSIQGVSYVEIITGSHHQFPTFSVVNNIVKLPSQTDELSSIRYAISSTLNHQLMTVGNPQFHYNEITNVSSLFVLGKCETDEHVKLYTYGLTQTEKHPSRFFGDWVDVNGSLGAAELLRSNALDSMQHAEAERLTFLMGLESNARAGEVYGKLFKKNYFTEISPPPLYPYSSFINWMNFYKILLARQL